MQQKILEALSQYDPLEAIVSGGLSIIILSLFISFFISLPLKAMLDYYYENKNKDIFEGSEKLKMIDVLDKLANSEIKEGLILIIDGCEYELDHEGIFRRKTDLECVVEADIMYDYYLDESFLNAEVELKGVEEDEDD
ncbi:hypothetical protein [Enterococcus cecorum]